ncbi:TetR/AcrR family transcriptional regulator [Brevibacterium sp. JSBI002]|uniref:HTH tetR-type domain-containing protein n=2 Tax=Brevibacterium linens TaxID=1703 RepID=A0A144MCS5_BRELN|nr:TetR/AcrR family transcriptional regulator [Brevibacterium sp. JSBI002]AMT92890.1 hypothetical protein A2T55_03020 [Brevibacterium linens]UZD62717.1 TetR/AcrR family transcriptional regulator [Brevibacterium sp. JSBI002]
MTTSLSSAEQRTANMPKQDRSRATRDRILRSTISCLAEFGWHGTTTTLVAERTGISRGALQHHFPKREDLFLTAIDFIFDEQKQEGVLGVDAAPTKGDDFDFIVEKVLEYYASDVFKAALQIWSVGASEPTLKERIRPLENKFARGIYDQTVTFLNADVSDERTHRFIQTTLDLARGLGLADLLSDDSARRKRIAKFWAGEMRSIKQLDSDE